MVYPTFPVFLLSSHGKKKTEINHPVLQLCLNLTATIIKIKLIMDKMKDLRKKSWYFYCVSSKIRRELSTNSFSQGTRMKCSKGSCPEIITLRIWDSKVLSVESWDCGRLVLMTYVLSYTWVTNGPQFFFTKNICTQETVITVKASVDLQAGGQRAGPVRTPHSHCTGTAFACFSECVPGAGSLTSHLTWSSDSLWTPELEQEWLLDGEKNHRPMN